MSDRKKNKDEPSSPQTIDKTTSEILENIGNGLLILDESHTILHNNHVVEQLLGQQQLIGQQLAEVLPQVTLEPLGEQRLLKVFHDGRPFLLSYRSTATTLQEKKGFVVYFKDVTQIENLRLEMKKLERLAEAGRMSSIVAHEIRNPLAGIKAIIQSIRKEVTTLGLDYAMDMISCEIERLNKLLKEYSSLRKKRSLRRQLTNFDKIIEFVQFACGERLKGIDFSYQFKNLSPILVDPEQMRQLFLNLTLNAIDATPPGGFIRIRGQIADSSLIVDVQDSGIGINKTEFSKIFEDFYTTKAHGTGLGLSICSQIVKEHDGTIQFKSKLGKGTLVRVTLPLIEPF